MLTISLFLNKYCVSLSQHGLCISVTLKCLLLSTSMEDSPTAVDCVDLNEELDMVSMEGLKPLQTGLSSLFDIDETTIWGWLEPGKLIQ